MANIEHAAALLAQARRSMQLIPGLPEACRPASVAEAHAIQDATTTAIRKSVGAYKATNPPDGEPTRGLIYDGTIHPTPASIPAASVPACGVEGEVAFIFRRDLPARAQAYTRDEVAAAVDALAAIEVVDSRYADRNKVSNLENLADSVSNGAFVHAAPITNWQGLELGRLRVRLTVNGETVLDREGGHPTGDPLGVATALVNQLRDKGGVRAGQFVTCGTFTGLRFLKPGDVCGVAFDGLGDAQVTFAR
ncbi:MAG TPA: fumarylacetoacetate hydrolase family protein [Acetobacteraceae bacterium]|jgi:2-keto-4-pentenoate hydratase